MNELKNGCVAEDRLRQIAAEYPDITVDSRIRSGAPCITGTRIPVYAILRSIGSRGSVEGAIQAHSGLTWNQVRSAVSFAAEVLRTQQETD